MMVRLRFLVILLLLCLPSSPRNIHPQELILLDVQVEVLGRGASGTVVGLLVGIAPEDRALVGDRLQIRATLSSPGDVIDEVSVDALVDSRGIATVYREWSPGDYHLKVTASSLTGPAIGLASVEVEIPKAETPFQPPSPKAEESAVGITPPKGDALHFISIPNLDRLAAFSLEVAVPEGCSSVDFFQDDKLLIRRKSPPWSVQVKTRMILERSEFTARALDAMGRILGEDAIVINSPAGKSGLRILIAPESAGLNGRRSVTVAVLDRREFQELSLNLDDVTVARWKTCPCVTEVPMNDLQNANILSAEIVDSRGNRFVEVSRVGRGFGEGIRVDLVELQVQVSDAHDVPVIGLDQKDFSVFEDGQEIEIDGVGTQKNQTLSLVIAVDSSESMLQSFSEIRRAVTGFADNILSPGDQAALIRFSSNSEVLVSWSNNPVDIRQGLAEVYPRGATSLNDAVIQSLMQIHGRRGRKAVVLLTDGADTSSLSSFSDTQWFSKSMRVPIFVITLATGDPHRYAKTRDIQDVRDRDRMMTLARETGGRAYFQITTDRLPSVYQEISDILRSQYVLWFRPDPEKPVNRFRRIEVRVNDRKYKVRSASGYYPGR